VVVGSTNEDDANGKPGIPSEVVETLWVALSDVMGNAATATVLRRAALRASERAPELSDFSVVRERFVYRYTVPESWSAGTQQSHESLRELFSELRPLLIDLTGSVVLQRLHGIPALRNSGLFAPEERE
jgi:hypothetical protein